MVTIFASLFVMFFFVCLWTRLSHYFWLVKLSILVSESMYVKTLFKADNIENAGNEPYSTSPCFNLKVTLITLGVG